MSNIPLVDLGFQARAIYEEVQAAWAEILGRTAFIGGSAVGEFESAYAAYSSVKHVIGVANGTDALEIGVRALDIGHGDEVIVPTNSFIASALAVARAGATPVLVDCDPTHYLIDVSQIEHAITPRTRAIMPVHRYGQLAPREEVCSIADKHGLAVVEDAAQSQGAIRNGCASGSFGTVTGTSFYPGKNLGAFGDAGAVLTNSDDIAKKVRALRNYGSEIKYHHPETGFNSRLDTLQAAVLSAKLRRLDAWNEQRRHAAELYQEMLGGVEAITTPGTLDGNTHVWHLYAVEVDNRDGILAELNAQGIGAGIHYPTPIHLHGAFAHLNYSAGAFPVAETSAPRILSLPIFPGITDAQVEEVAYALIKAVG
ncbi:MAG: DegT/DnrJ/EryC1/StrS family aminotransferase [Actinomycetota bacterium]